MSIISTIFIYFKSAVYPRFVDLVAAPYYHSELLWITIPLIIVLLLMEFYFGRYRKEELGWNTAVGNALVLLFVAMDLYRHLYETSAFKDFFNFIFLNAKGVFIATVIVAEGFWLLFANFYHILPKRFAFFASAALQINMTAYVAIVLVYSNLELDLATIIAAIILYFILLGFFALIHLIEPKAKEVLEIKEKTTSELKKEIKPEKK